MSTGIYPDNYTLPSTQFNENCVYSATGTFTTGIGETGTGNLNLGSASKTTNIAGLLARPSTSIDRLIAQRITTAQTIGTTNTDVVIVWNQSVEQIGSISVNTTTGVITIPRAGFYYLQVAGCIQSGTANSYGALGYTSAATTTSNSVVSTGFQPSGNRPIQMAMSEIIFFSAATTLSITTRCSNTATILSLATTGNMAINRIQVTYLY